MTSHSLRTELTVYHTAPGVRFEKRTKLYLSSQQAHWIAARFARRHRGTTVAVVAPSLPGISVLATFYPCCSDCKDPHRPVFMGGRCYACYARYWAEGEREAREAAAIEQTTCSKCGATGVPTAPIVTRRYCGPCSEVAWDLLADALDAGEGEIACA